GVAPSFLLFRPRPGSPLFPYTTLFRSLRGVGSDAHHCLVRVDSRAHVPGGCKHRLPSLHAAVHYLGASGVNHHAGTGGQRIPRHDLLVHKRGDRHQSVGISSRTHHGRRGNSRQTPSLTHGDNAHLGGAILTQPGHVIGGRISTQPHHHGRA